MKLDKRILGDLRQFSRAMFEREFFGLYQGAISHKINENRFIINTQNAVFSDISLIALSFKRDYSYQEASTHAQIHSTIYREIDEARCIAHTIPPYTMAYSLQHLKIIPKDYFGYKCLREVAIYDPKEFSSWDDRADTEICALLKLRNFAVIKGFGVYVFGRDLLDLMRTVEALEHSTKILTLYNLENTLFKYKLELTKNANI